VVVVTAGLIVVVAAGTVVVVAEPADLASAAAVSA
jgi:hypothetical protein